MIARDKAFDLIAQRSVWEGKQRIYFQLRHDGLRRTNKPFPTAADFHFPLIDMTIADLKPFWMSQIFSGQRLADFISMQQDLEGTCEAAADFLSFDLRHFSDFRYKMERAVDTMLHRGRGLYKGVWDPAQKEVFHQSVDPTNILVDQQFDELIEADFFVEIQPLSLGQYQRNPKYNQDKGIIEKIKGRPAGDWGLSAELQEKELVEGVTHSTKGNQIVLWNIYEQTASGWLLHTRCPMQWDDVEICASQCVPYEWQGKTLLPFYSMTQEIKNAGWFAPRGISELLASFEVYATKLWNDKADAMTFGNKPLFTSEGEITNTANIRFAPGELIPGNVKAVQMPPPAFSFSEEINFTRSLAERRSRTPDFGQFAPEEGAQGQGGKPITATQSRIAAGLQAVGADHNGDTFREVRLSKILKHNWALRVQFTPSRTSYFIGKELKQLPQQALHDQYLVIPAGGNGSKQEQLQRAIARFQLFKGAPNVDQDELVKDVVAADDARKVNSLLIPQSQKAASEAYAEDLELMVLSQGRPVPVLAGQDHVTRIKEIVGYLEKQHVTGEPVNPIALQRIQEHLAQHFQILQQLQPQVAKQLKVQIQQMEQQAVMGNGNGRAMTPQAMPNGAPQ